ncbi:MAG: LLM class flavin-dependent oxidoreductase [Pseudomonadota bacterium]
MSMILSCAFATSRDSHEHALVAEQLGYQHAWFYDSPALYADVWVQMCRAAERTSTIGLGPAVLVPNLRHPMTNAAALSTLVDIAGAERVAVTIGSGFTGRLTLGQRPLKWAYVADYVRTLRGLLAGEEMTWEGKQIQMMQPEGFAPARPIDVPILIAAAGPKGMQCARELGDGVFTTQPAGDAEVARNPVLTMGTVLDVDENAGSARALAAAGHGAAVALHMALEFGNEEALPNGAAWAAAYAGVPPAQRHLALHDQHLVAVNERDRPFVTGPLLEQLGLAMPAEAWRERLQQMQARGTTEVVYQPAGDDIPRELEAFAKVMT